MNYECSLLLIRQKITFNNIQEKSKVIIPFIQHAIKDENSKVN